MNNFKTKQEEFWAGEFGESYIGRNSDKLLLASNLSFFSKSLSALEKISSCMEFGANVGMNLMALKMLFPNVEFSAIEINKKAAEYLANIVPEANIHVKSILDYEPKAAFDLVLIKGVLIHINPEELKQVYDKLVKSTKKYLLICEYYNPVPVKIPYRGHEDRLFKRDFAGEILDYHPSLLLKNYGFVYKRDNCFPQDDITWFLLEKRS